MTAQEAREFTCGKCQQVKTWIPQAKDSEPPVCGECMAALAAAFWAVTPQAPGRQVSHAEVAVLLGRHEHGTGA